MVGYHIPWTPGFSRAGYKVPGRYCAAPRNDGTAFGELVACRSVDHQCLPDSSARSPVRVTNYSLKARDQYECAVKADWMISVWPTPVIRLGADTTICPEGMAVLSAPSGFNKYMWSTGSVNSEITVSPAGNYWVCATDGHGCSASDTIRVNQFAAPQPKIKGNKMDLPGSDHGTRRG